MKSKLDKILKISQELLYNFAPAEECLNYLNSRIATEYQQHYQFGYLPSLQHLHYLTNFISLSELEECGILYRNQSAYSLHLEYHNLIIPFYDVYGTLISLVGRTLLSEIDRKEQKIAKYKNLSFNKGKHLFGLNYAKQDILQKNSAILVEGQFDCLSCYSHGIKNVVALGNSNLTLEQMFLILRYCDKIILLLDNDLAGQQGMVKIKEKYARYCQIQECYLPSGIKDVDEYLSQGNKLEQLYA